MIKINTTKRNQMNTISYFLYTDKQWETLSKRRNIYVNWIMCCCGLRYSIKNCDEYFHGEGLRDDSLIGNV